MLPEVGVALIALDRTRQTTHSALPDAPTVASRPTRQRRVRRRTAVTLRRLADRLQPV